MFFSPDPGNLLNPIFGIGPDPASSEMGLIVASPTQNSSGGVV